RERASECMCVLSLTRSLSGARNFSLVRAVCQVLAEGRFLESDAAADSTEINSDAADTNYSADTTAVAHTGMERGADEGAQCMWKVANAHMEEAQLLSFVALAGLEPEVRVCCGESLCLCRLGVFQGQSVPVFESVIHCVCLSLCMCVSRFITHARDQVRLWGLDQASTQERLKRGLDVLRERKQILQAKMALCSLNFD
ncbi:MAG: hypothetical protein ACPIOQ_53215, partial [Promethearchaeia archaeon]